MADNLSISITADTASLRAQLAQAQADVRAYGAEVRKLADTLRSAGADAKGGLQAELQAAAGKLGQATSAAAALRGELGQHARNADEAGGALHRFGDAAGETRARVGELAAALGLGLGVEKIIDGVETLAEMGERTINTAKALGVSAEEYAKLSAAIKLAGGDSDGAIRVYSQLERAMKTALADPASSAGSAFLALRISGQQLRDGLQDLPEAIKVVADALAKIPDSPLKAAYLREIIGGVRGLKETGPLFEGGRKGLEEREETTVRSGSAPDQETLKALKETAEEINRLKDAFTGLGVKIFQEFKTPIDLSIGSLQSFVDGAKAGTKSIHDLVGELDTLGGAALGAGAGFLVGGPVGALAGGAVGGVAGVSGIVAAVERIKTDLGTIADAWGSVDEWVKAHSGLGAHLLPDSWTEPHPFLGPQPLPAPAQPGVGFGTRAQREGPPQAAPAAAPGVADVDIARDKKNLDLALKAIDEERKAREAELDYEITAAKGRQATIETIEKQKLDVALEAIAKRQAAEQAFHDKLKSLGADEAQIAAAHTPDEAGAKIATIEIQNRAAQQAQAAAERQAETAIRGLEARRRIADQQEAADLRSVERQEKLGQITVAAAAAAELQIVAAHRAAVDAILAQEERAAAGQEKLEHEVAARKAELAQQTADQIRDINEKAQDEALRRAHATDQSIAAGLASALTSGGKESLGQAVQKVFQEQEKQVLERGIAQLLDASGIGKALNSGADALLGFLPGAPKDKPEDALRSATADNTAATRDNTAALRDKAPMAPGGAAPTAASSAAPAAAPTAAAPAAPAQYAATIGAAAAQYNVPPAILTNLLGAESGFKPNAEGPPVASRGGESARWLGQFMPAEARKYGVTDDQSSIGGAAHYLSDLYAAKGSWAGALGAYSNQGPALSGYAAQKNPYGPALVAAAGAADRGPALSGAIGVAAPAKPVAAAAGAPSAPPLPEAAATETPAPAAAPMAAAPEFYLGAMAEERPAQTGALPVDVQAVAGSSVSASDGLPVMAPETSATGSPLSDLLWYRPPPSGVTAAGPSITGEAPLSPEPTNSPLAAALGDFLTYLPPPSGVTAQGVSITGEPALAPEAVSGAGATNTQTGFPSVADRHDEAAPAADFGTGFPSVADRHDETPAAELGNGFPGVADKIEDLKGSLDKLTTSTDKAAAEKGAPAATAGGAGDQSGLGSLLGLVALGGVAAAAFGRRTTGSAASSSPGAVFNSGGITTQTSGAVHPALVQTNPQPSAALGIAGGAIAGLGVLGALSKLFGGGPSSPGGGNKTPAQASSDAATQSNTTATQANTAALQAKPTAPANATTAPASAAASPAGSSAGSAGPEGAASAGGLTGATVSGATSGLTGLASAIGTLDPAAKTATSAFSTLVSGLSSLLGGLGGLFSGGGGGGAGGGGGLAGGLGGIFGLLTLPLKLLGGLFAARGAVVGKFGVPSAKDGLVLDRVPSAQGGLTVNDGMGGQVAVVHPNETILPSPISQLVQDLAEENRIGKIVAAQPQLGNFGLPQAKPASATGFAPPPAPAGPGRAAFASPAAGDTHNHYEGDTHNINVTAFDGHDVERLFLRNGSALARSLARQKRITNSSWSH